jgi:hypothetical protein
MVRKQGGSKSGSKVEANGFCKNASTFITALYIETNFSIL